MNVLVVDDHPLYRDGLINLLNSDHYFKVVGQAGTVREAIDLANRLQPDLVLMDFSLPDGNGAEASAAILEDQPDCKIVFLTMYDADEKLFEAIRSGAKGYLLKNTSTTELLNALKSLENGEAPISGKLTMRILEQLTHQHNDVSPNSLTRLHEILSLREIEVLREISLRCLKW